MGALVAEAAQTHEGCKGEETLTRTHTHQYVDMYCAEDLKGAGMERIRHWSRRQGPRLCGLRLCWGRWRSSAGLRSNNFIQMAALWFSWNRKQLWPVLSPHTTHTHVCTHTHMLDWDPTVEGRAFAWEEWSGQPTLTLPESQISVPLSATWLKSSFKNHTYFHFTVNRIQWHLLLFSRWLHSFDDGYSKSFRANFVWALIPVLSQYS